MSAVEAAKEAAARLGPLTDAQAARVAALLNLVVAGRGGKS